MNRLIAGVAVIALSASLAQAQPGQENRGNRGGDRPERSEQNQQRGPQPREQMRDVRQEAPQRQNDGARQQVERERTAQARDRATQVRERNAGQERQAQASRERAEVGRDRIRQQREPVIDRREDTRRLSERREDARVRPERSEVRRQNVREARGDGDRFRVIRNQADLRQVTYRNFGLIDGCPPGLARRNNGCTPPGLARARYADDRVDYYRPAYFGYDRFDSGRYWYENGYLYRLDSRNSIAGFIPLLGGALSVGQVWPSYYEPATLSPYYTEYYNLGDPYGYRYADDVIYRVDSGNSAITAIVALLTGDQFAIGQPMPMGYDVYNVPYDYRDTYYDTPDAYYRYSDGYIYEADPETQLITAAIELLV